MANIFRECLEATWYFTWLNMGATSKEIPGWEVLRQRQNTMFPPPLQGGCLVIAQSNQNGLENYMLFMIVFLQTIKYWQQKKQKGKNLPELLESCRTAVTAHNLNPRHTLEQKQSQPTGAKTPGPCWPKTSCFFIIFVIVSSRDFTDLVSSQEFKSRQSCHCGFLQSLKKTDLIVGIFTLYPID